MAAPFVLYAVAGFGLGFLVRWPILAIIAALSLAASVGALLALGYGVLPAVGWSFALVTTLELAYLLGVACAQRRLPRVWPPVVPQSSPTTGDLGAPNRTWRDLDRIDPADEARPPRGE